MESSKKSALEVHISKNNIMRPSVDDETSNDKNDDDNDSSSIYFNTVPYLIPRVHFVDHVELLDSYYPSKQSHQLQYQQNSHQQQQLKQQQQILSDYRIKYLKRILVVVSIMLVLQLSSFFGNMSTSDRNNDNDDASTIQSQEITEVAVLHPSLSERRAVWEGGYGQSDWSRVPPHLQGYYSKFNGRYDSSGPEVSRQSQVKDQQQRNHQQGTNKSIQDKESNSNVALSNAEFEEQQTNEQNVGTITYGTADDDIEMKERIDGQLQETSVVTKIKLRHQVQQQNLVDEEKEEEEINVPIDVDPTEGVRQRQVRQWAREQQRKRDRNKQKRHEKLLNR